MRGSLGHKNPRTSKAMEDLVSPVVRWIMGPSLCFSTVTVMPVPRSFFVSSTVCSELWPSGGLHLYLQRFCRIWQRDFMSLGNKTSKQQ